MTDIISPEKRSKMMSGIKGKNTKPEIIVRQELHKRGFRFRLHNKQLPGKPDIVLAKYKTVIFVNGCFWHGHNCHLFKWPKSNIEFWAEKITATKGRDKINKESLAIAGWHVITIWECSLKGKPKESISLTINILANEIKKSLNQGN